MKGTILWAVVRDTFREAMRKYTIITFFCLATLFLLFFLIFINLEVVQGTLTAVKLFGVTMGSKLDLKKVMIGIESGFAVALYYAILFFALFTMSDLIPNLVRRGRVDVYLSKPLSRSSLLLARGLGTILMVALCIFYLLFGMWIILSAKVGFVHSEFLITGLLVLYIFLVFHALGTLLGVAFANPMVSILVCYFMIIFEAILHGIMSSNAVDNWLVVGLYWLLPKTTGISASLFTIISGKGSMPWASFATTTVFGLVCYVWALVLFQRRDY